MTNIAKLVVGVFLLLVLYTMALTTSKEPLASNIEEKKVVQCSTSPTKWTCDPELRILAEAIYFESRSEYWTGQEAVAHVIVNRLKHPEFPDTIEEVVYQDSNKKNRCQFSYACDGRSEKIRDLAAWENCVVSASRVYYGMAKDNTGGATYYINRNISTNQAFFRTLELTKKIGSHTFYREANTVAQI